MRQIEDWRQYFTRRLASGLEADVVESWLFHPAGAKFRENLSGMESDPEICSRHMIRIRALISLLQGIPWLRITRFSWQPDWIEIELHGTEASLLSQILHGFWNDLPVSGKMKNSIAASMESRAVLDGVLGFSALLKIRVGEDMDMEEEALQILEAAVVAVPV